jgi:hypothetical protein
MPFFFAALCDLRPGGISKRDPHSDTCAPPIGENPGDSCVLGQEQRAISQDRDLTLGRSEQPNPVPLQNSMQVSELRFGTLGEVRQDHGSCLSVCCI